MPLRNCLAQDDRCLREGARLVQLEAAGGPTGSTEEVPR